MRCFQSLYRLWHQVVYMKHLNVDATTKTGTPIHMRIDSPNTVFLLIYSHQAILIIRKHYLKHISIENGVMEVDWRPIS